MCEGREREKSGRGRKGEIFSASVMPNIELGWIRKKGHLGEWQEATPFVWAIQGHSSPIGGVRLCRCGGGAHWQKAWADGLDLFVQAMWPWMDPLDSLPSQIKQCLFSFLIFKELLLRFLLSLLQTLKFEWKPCLLSRSSHSLPASVNTQGSG